MKKMDLTKIGFFNPGRLTDEEIELSFIARNSLFQFLFKKIIDHPAKAIPQHLLIIGQRGMGKTSLLMRLAVELKKAPYNKCFIPLNYPEEQYNIDRLSKFWLNSLDALADALDKEGETKLIKELDKEVDELSSGTLPNSTELFQVFDKWTQKTKRWPVLLVDNLNLLFDKISIEEQHKLRAILMKPGAPIMVGASATTVEQAVDYGAPFYDAFQTQYLQKLSLQESIEILRNMALLTGKPLDTVLSKQRGRVAALYELTGGTPRTLAMLFPLITDGFGTEIQDDLDALLDVVTPLYKARFEELPAQMQVTLDAIALNWDPIDLEQLRNTTQLESAKLSPQLKRLVDVGRVQKLKSSKTKGAVYEISERFFNVWYLMRRSSRRMKRELYCLSKFLEAFYGADVDQMAQQRLLHDLGSKESAYLDLALALAVNDQKLKNELKERSYQALIQLSKHDSSILKSFDIPESKIINEMDKLQWEMNSYFQQENWTATLEKSAEILSLDSNLPQIYLVKGVCYQRLAQYLDSEKAYKKAVSIDLEYGHAWYALAELYRMYLKQYAQSESAYQKALKLNDQFASAWLGLGDLYQVYLDSYEKSEKAYKKVIDLDKNNVDAWSGLGYLYMKCLDRYEESEKAYREALFLDSGNVLVWNYLGDLYQLYLKRHNEAEDAYKKAIVIDEQFAYSWYSLGNLYRVYLDRYQDSEEAYKKALSINEKWADVWNDLGILYQDDLENHEKAKLAYQRASELDPKMLNSWFDLGDLYQIYESYEESENAYKHVLDLNPENVSAWNRLGDLYQYYLNRYEESENAYKKAISLEHNQVHSWKNLGDLYQYYLGRFEDSEKAYNKAILLDREKFDVWSSLGNLKQDRLHCFEEAESSYKKAIKSNNEYSIPTYNLVFLYRDKLDKLEEARELLNGIPESQRVRDTHFLNLALFAYRDQNVGIAKEHLQMALGEINNSFSIDTKDDWWRAAVTAIKLGYGPQFIEAFEESGHNISLRPYYEAVKAMMEKDSELYFNTIAAEVRKPAKEIFEIFQRYKY